MSNPATSSGLKTADTAILAGPGRLLGVQLIADLTNACTVVIYDNATAASGLVLCKLSIPATGAFVDALLPAEGVVVNNGIYADVAGTGAGFIVHFTPA